MAEIGGFVAPFAFGYGAALVGVLAACLLRAGARYGRHTPTLREAWCCAFLPFLSVVLLSVIVLIQPHWLPPFEAFHAGWHRWEAAIHRSEALHSLLHGANWLVLSAGVWLVGRTVFVASRMRGFAKTLQETARATADPAVYTLSAGRPLCFTVGLWRPQIYVTRELLAQLDPRDYRAVLAHERAHVRRRDTLTGAALTLFYTLLPLPGSGLLLREWRLAVERACDQEAALQLGSRSDVALALVRVARLMAQPSPALPNAACFTEWGEDVEGRVQALLEPAPKPEQPRFVAGTFVTFSMGLVAAAALWVPHVVDLFAHH